MYKYMYHTFSSLLLSPSLRLPQTHLSFGREFTEAVEMKQVAQQEAERARFLVEKVSDFFAYACTLYIYI